LAWVPSHLSLEEAVERGLDGTRWPGNFWAAVFAAFAIAELRSPDSDGWNLSCWLHLPGRRRGLAFGLPAAWLRLNATACHATRLGCFRTVAAAGIDAITQAGSASQP
ncbi:unnamed protein product, partial [Prorocentrum cordatum]